MIAGDLNSHFLPCYYFCNIPKDQIGAWYLFVVTFFFFSMTFFQWITFYVFPRDYKSLILNQSKEIHADIIPLNTDGKANEDEFYNKNELVLLSEIEKNNNVFSYSSETKLVGS